MDQGSHNRTQVFIAIFELPLSWFRHVGPDLHAIAKPPFIPLVLPAFPHGFQAGRGHGRRARPFMNILEVDSFRRRSGAGLELFVFRTGLRDNADFEVMSRIFPDAFLLVLGRKSQGLFKPFLPRFGKLVPFAVLFLLRLPAGQDQTFLGAGGGHVEKSSAFGQFLRLLHIAERLQETRRERFSGSAWMTNDDGQRAGIHLSNRRLVHCEEFVPLAFDQQPLPLRPLRGSLHFHHGYHGKLQSLGRMNRHDLHGILAGG